MDENAGSKPSMLKPFAIGYLVWHVLTSLVTLALLGYVSANFFALANFWALTMPVLGLTVSVALLVIAGWVIYVLLVLAGLAFGLGAIGVWGGFSRHALAIGRVMLALCVLNLVFGLVQANILTILSEGITILLTGALIHELKQETRESLDASAGGGDATGSVASHSNNATYMRFEGYVLIMFVWGALRVLSGLAMVFNGGFAITDEPSVRRVVTGGLIALVGLYLVVTGRYGKAALASTKKLVVFRRLGIIGLVLSALGFAPTLVWAVSSAQLLSSDMFCTIINLALYAASVYYANALEKSLKSF